MPAGGEIDRGEVAKLFAHTRFAKRQRGESASQSDGTEKLTEGTAAETITRRVAHW